MTGGGTMRRKRGFWILVVVVCGIGGVLYVGQRYFNGFNNFLNNPKCVSDCWENGKRVR